MSKMENGRIVRKHGMMNENITKVKDSLFHKYFHTFNEKHEIKYQGRIEGKIQEGYYIVQLYGWLFGQPSCQKIFHIDDMREWDFYIDEDEMKSAYDKINPT